MSTSGNGMKIVWNLEFSQSQYNNADFSQLSNYYSSTNQTLVNTINNIYMRTGINSLGVLYSKDGFYLRDSNGDVITDKNVPNVGTGSNVWGNNFTDTITGTAESGGYYAYSIPEGYNGWVSVWMRGEDGQHGCKYLGHSSMTHTQNATSGNLSAGDKFGYGGAGGRIEAKWNNIGGKRLIFHYDSASGGRGGRGGDYGIHDTQPGYGGRGGGALSVRLYDANNNNYILLAIAGGGGGGGGRGRKTDDWTSGWYENTQGDTGGAGGGAGDFSSTEFSNQISVKTGWNGGRSQHNVKYSLLAYKGNRETTEGAWPPTFDTGGGTSSGGLGGRGEISSDEQSFTNYATHGGNGGSGFNNGGNSYTPTHWTNDTQYTGDYSKTGTNAGTGNGWWSGGGEGGGKVENIETNRDVLGEGDDGGGGGGGAGYTGGGGGGHGKGAGKWGGGGGGGGSSYVNNAYNANHAGSMSIHANHPHNNDKSWEVFLGEK